MWTRPLRVGGGGTQRGRNGVGSSGPTQRHPRRELVSARIRGVSRESAMGKVLERLAEELNRKAGEARRFSRQQGQQTVPNIVWEKQRSHDQKSEDLLPESRVPTVPVPKSRNIDDFAMLTAEVAARLDSLPDLQILHSVQRNPGRATLEAQIATHASRSGPVTRPSPTELEQLGGRLQASIWMRQLKYSVVEVCGEPSSSTLL